MIETDQNDEYWENVLRVGPAGIRIGSSDVGTALGIDTYKHPSSLYDYITNIRGTQIDIENRKLDKEDIMKSHGHAGEPVVCNFYAKISGYELKRGNYWVHPKYTERFGCSPDRRAFFNGEFVGLMEAKTCYNKLHEVIPPGHEAQIMYQLWITGANHCDYVACMLDKEDPWSTKSPPTLALRAYASQNYFNWMERRLLRFSKCLEEKKKIDFKLAWVEKDPPPISNYISLTSALYGSDNFY